MAEGWRFIAVRALPEEVLDWEVPLTLSSNPRRDLSGPGSMNGAIEPEYSRLLGPDGRPIIEEWGTKLFLEVDGALRWGGIVTKTSFDGPKAMVQCEGFSAYAHGIPYESHMLSGPLITPKDPYAGKDKNHDGWVDGKKGKQKVPPPPKPYGGPRIDAFVAFRNIWNHIQSRPYGNIGLTIDDGYLGDLLGAADGSDPWELAWWNHPDCGQALDQLAQSIPFDWIETHAWTGTGNQIDSRIRLGRPRLGRKRDDLRFADGENIAAIAKPEGMGDEYANEVMVLGKGEGRKMWRFQVHRYEAGRLRRVVTVADKSLKTAATMRARGMQELNARTGSIQIPAIQLINHPNARFGAWQLGDDIRVQVHVPWYGDIDLWHRIVSEEISTDGGTCVLNLRRSDSFVY
ncbi:hypothetical protein SSP531S_54010 [Streptomyces spongiicola]|uniref:Minor tail protein n=1 Tax=Streptomyces spongiicola TaxID=1690221 RepID=A0A388T6Q7_9ACTN|nr:hypothetical protein [Streptomyces spongiicola]GBQ03922.1 hypothetical protein SSP531S_54010 [Streptomyces spongiicola]